MFGKGAFQERRQFGRRSVLKHAIICDDEGGKRKCTVVDMSEGGARIKLDDVDKIPGEFLVEIPADDFVVRCRIVHRQPDSIGVEFARSPSRISWRGNRAGKK